MSEEINKLFCKLKNFLDSKVKSIGNQLDTDDQLLHDAFKQFCTIGSLKLLVPTDCHGLGGKRIHWIDYNILIAQYSGALLFLQAQHQYAIVKLNQLLPCDKISNLLKQLVDTNTALGIVSTKNKPSLQVKKLGDKLFLSGKLNWVTGYGYLSQLLISFEMENSVYCTLIPFNNVLKEKGKLLISPRLETTVFNAAYTVSILLEDYPISLNEIFKAKNPNDKNASEHPAVYNFAGAAKALLEIASLGKYNNTPLAKEHGTLLLAEWESYYNDIIQNNICPLKLRAKGFLLADRCANFARMAHGASAVLSSNAISRISREIWLYTVIGYSSEQLNEYLNEYL